MFWTTLVVANFRTKLPPNAKARVNERTCSQSFANRRSPKVSVSKLNTIMQSTAVYYINDTMLHLPLTGIGCGISGSAACLFRNILHVGHLPTVFSMSLFMPGQNTAERASALHLSIPRWPSWMRKRMSFRKPDGMTIRLLCRIRPSCSYRSAARARN